MGVEKDNYLVGENFWDGKNNFRLFFNKERLFFSRGTLLSNNARVLNSRGGLFTY